MIRASESLIWFQSVLSLSSGSAQFVFPSRAPVLYKLANNTRPSGVTPVSTHQFPLSDTKGRADENISKCWQEDAHRMDLCRCMMQRGLNKKTGRQIAWGERLSALDWAFSLWSHLGISNEACVVCHLSTLSLQKLKFNVTYRKCDNVTSLTVWCQTGYFFLTPNLDFTFKTCSKLSLYLYLFLSRCYICLGWICCASIPFWTKFNLNAELWIRDPLCACRIHKSRFNKFRYFLNCYFIYYSLGH